MKVPLFSFFSKISRIFSKKALVFGFVLVFVAGAVSLIANLGSFSSFGQKMVAVAATGSSGSGGGGAGGAGGSASENEGEGNNNDATPLCGFAWGGTGESLPIQAGVGWVSFNSKDCDANEDGDISSSEAAAMPGCPVMDDAGEYSVEVDSNRNLVGTAWSSNLGWLKFGGLDSAPSPSISGNDQQNARIDNNSGVSRVSGWARFCAGTADGECADMASRTDGWDGWVSLRGDKTSTVGNNSTDDYKVTFNSSTHKFSGESWGGEVVGWLDWSPDSGNGVRYCTVPTISVSLTATPSSGDASPEEPLSSVLTATPSPSSDPSDRYRFTCDRLNTALSPSQAGSTFDCDNYYTQAGTTYVPLVELTRGDLQATSTARIVTNPGVVPPAPLQISCTAVPKPVEVNSPVTWTAKIDNPSDPLPVAGYRYEFKFYKNNSNTLDVSTQAQPNPVIIPNSLNVNEAGHVLEQVQRTYSTLGNKFVVVKVTDNDTGAWGQCPPVDSSVVVQTTIIEI